MVKTFLKGDIMTRSNEQAETMRDSNRIQEQHSKETSDHNKKMRSLQLVIVALAIITLWSSCNQTGRYAISGGKGGVYVLDTKTSQLWQRASNASKNLYFGTNENPMGEIISRRVKTFEEIGIKSETNENNK